LSIDRIRAASSVRGSHLTSLKFYKHGYSFSRRLAAASALLLEGGGGEVQRRGGRGLELRGVDDAVAVHRVEHDIDARGGFGVEGAGAADAAAHRGRLGGERGEEGGLADRELARSAGEPVVGGRADPEDAGAELDEVEVALEDLGLGEASFQAPGQDGF